ncbi:MAG: M28 family peptidase [Myxococcota bacterium]|nr:M28 family peptidase [Myxococcota bacterium]
MIRAPLTASPEQRFRSAVLALVLASAMACAGGTAHRALPPGVDTEPEILLSAARQLTFAGRRSGEGYWSADGSALVFQSEREEGNPFYQIYRMELDTGAVSRVSPGVGKTTCAWLHPEGERVLYASTEHDPRAAEKQEAELAERASGRERRYAWDYDPEYELYVRDPASDAARRLTEARGYDAEGSFSPDGQRVLFASNRHAYAAGLAGDEAKRLETEPSHFIDLYVMAADGSDPRRLTDTPGYDGGPFWSADGSRIVWRRFAPDGASAEIWVMDADGSNARAITQLGALSWAPYFHPSGDYVIFATNLHGFGNFELYLVDTAGDHTPLRVTWRDGFDGLPAFSPDGARLAWTSARSGSGRPQLFVADWDDAKARELLGLPASAVGLAAPRAAVPADAARQAREAALRRDVEQLASEAMQGRLTGSEGERLSTEYVATAFEGAGLEPAGSDGGWFESFEFTAGVSLGADNRLAVPGGPSWEVERDWRPLAFSRLGRAAAAPVAFAGYGLVAPASNGIDAYDAYGDLDVSGHWVLVLRYQPQGVPPETRQHWSRYASLRHKALVARERGAHGLLVASGPHSKVREPLVALRLDGAAGASSLAAISVRDEVADALLAASGHRLGALQGALDAGEVRPGFVLPGAELEAAIDLVLERRTGRNVIGRLPAHTGSPHAGSLPALVVGAHVDHLGRGEGGTSLARPDERGDVHYGADDNASGTAALIEMARTLAERRRRGEIRLARDVLFAAWSGEELGLLGSDAWARQRTGNPHHGPGLAAEVSSYLNLDMVGRLDRQLAVQGLGSSADWAALLEGAAAPLDLPVLAQQETYLPTDATSFYLRGVPFLSAFTGGHAEYHTPRDTPDRIDHAGLERTTELMARLAEALATRVTAPAHRATPRPAAGPARTGLRAYLGTIPDYTREVVGVALSGVIEGGPASRAGLRAGDVIVGLAGRRIENIYDYTYAIEALAIGEEVEVEVERDGERLRLRLVPESRE